MEGGRPGRREQVRLPRPSGNVGMSCCCFSGNKSDREYGEGVSATQVRVGFLVLKGYAKLSLFIDLIGRPVLPLCGSPEYDQAWDPFPGLN